MYFYFLFYFFVDPTVALRCQVVSRLFLFLDVDLSLRGMVRAKTKALEESAYESSSPEGQQEPPECSLGYYAPSPPHFLLMASWWPCVKRVKLAVWTSVRRWGTGAGGLKPSWQDRGGGPLLE